MKPLHSSPRTLLVAGAVVSAAALLAGCGATGPTYPGGPVSQPAYGGQPAYGSNVPAQAGVQHGRVESVNVVQGENQTSGAGAALGGVLGAVVGRQIGDGSGRTAATIAGAVGGAIVGNQVEKHRGGARDFVRVVVRFDRGGTRTFDFEPGVSVQPGERVYVQNDQLMRY